jgi:excisionase family DNA binding protein
MGGRSVMTKNERARYLLNQAVKRGDMVRPSACSLCGVVGRIEGHHESYDEPYVVEWLCQTCHWTHRHGKRPPRLPRPKKVARKRAVVAPGYWSIADVAEWLSVKASTIKKYVKHRGLPCMRPAGKLMYFDPAEVLAWLKQSGEAA